MTVAKQIVICANIKNTDKNMPRFYNSFYKIV